MAKKKRAAATDTRTNLEKFYVSSAHLLRTLNDLAAMPADTANDSPVQISVVCWLGLADAAMRDAKDAGLRADILNLASIMGPREYFAIPMKDNSPIIPTGDDAWKTAGLLILGFARDATNLRIFERLIDPIRRAVALAAVKGNRAMPAMTAPTRVDEAEKYIRENPGHSAKQIAEGINTSAENLKNHILPALDSRGLIRPGSGSGRGYRMGQK